ncbi:MAG: ATP-dependent RNA helicase, partial [Trichococcus flocculiformis]|nr:ATP-dependent RNA helicase [Trichococcus flocculiformis]
LRTIEKLTGKAISPLRPPSDEEALVGQLKNAIDSIDTLVKETESEKYDRAIKHLMDKYTTEELASALIKSQTKEATEVPVTITPERPLPSRGGGKKGGSGYRGKSGGYKGKSGGSRSGDRRQSGDRNNKGRSFSKARDSRPSSGGKRRDDRKGSSKGSGKPSFKIRSND